MAAPPRSDWIVVGSGFGGSVSALRLAEKGWRVLVLEQGRRFAPEDFPRSNWRLRRWLWAPRLGCRGPFRISLLRHLTVFGGVGVGGGSLVYANTLPRPPAAFFREPGWSELADWERELEPHYRTAEQMLGATSVPEPAPADRALAALARRLGRAGDWSPTRVGVWFGRPAEQEPDPFFAGEGPPVTGCTRCGGCMIGCRVGAKNTLDRNYLHLAERRGAEIRPETRVTAVRALPEGGYRVEAGRRVWLADRVVLAAGVLGTVRLLLSMRRAADGLPRVSARAGRDVRTNSEALIGVTTRRRDLDLSAGVAIGSILRVDERSSLEPVRYPSRSGAFRLLMAPHAPGRNAAVRLARAAAGLLRNPGRWARAYWTRDWARHTAILLFMRVHEGRLDLELGRGDRLRSRVGLGPAPTAAIPEASRLAAEYAEEVEGVVGSLITETVFGIPSTAHLLGGATMGAGPEEGVIGPDHQVHGHPGLYVVDGAAVSANPGVNPSLTIAALAERAMAAIPARPT
ncbi:MAG: GMC family oxidoreductase [Planctomycetota bacterium]|nr:MAG: GMC family oxidoreductase [Planctomycetota bacterium]